MPIDCAVALVDRRELPIGDWTSYLSVREQLEASTYRAPRRARTITSRILTKYLATANEAPAPFALGCRPGPVDPASLAGPKGPTLRDGEVQTAIAFRRLNADDIEAGRRGDWTSLEVLSGTATARLGATIVRAGHRCSHVSASSSHCGTYTVSCVGRDRVGLDLERIDRRRREFYAQTFSADERAWVAALGERGDGRRAEAAFTLLWSVKEAYLKASGRSDISVWAFPRWSVRFDEPVDGALHAACGEEFVRVSGGIHCRGFSQALDIAAMRVGDMILATVQYRDSIPGTSDGTAMSWKR